MIKILFIWGGDYVPVSKKWRIPPVYSAPEELFCRGRPGEDGSLPRQGIKKDWRKNRQSDPLKT
jgi:hypothetical protein